MTAEIFDWVARNCNALQPVLDTAERAIKGGNTKEAWSCPNCEVRVAVRRRRLISGYGMRLIDVEKCAEAPTFDQNLP